MAEIINLRRARKTKARAQADAKADENRARFGRPKAERTLTAKIDDLAAKRLEGHRLEGGQPEGPRGEPDRAPDDKQ